MKAGHQLHQCGLLVAGPVAVTLLERKALLAALIPPRYPASQTAYQENMICVNMFTTAGSWLETHLLAFPLPCHNPAIIFPFLYIVSIPFTL